MEMPRPGAIERAMQLAATGHFRTVTQIKQVLRGESYAAVDAQFSGAGIRRQLKGIMQASGDPAPPERFESTLGFPS